MLFYLPTQAVTVHCRIRPPAREDAGERIEWQYNPSQIMEDTKMGKKIYTFDHVFMKNNENCYALTAQALIRKAMKGYNVTVFAYGQTGAGKTHSMMGSPWPISAETDRGIIPQAPVLLQSTVLG